MARAAAAKKCTAPIPLSRVARDAEVGFVHERGGLQGLIRLPLEGEPRSRELPQFVIDLRQHLTGGARAIVVPRH